MSGPRAVFLMHYYIRVLRRSYGLFEHLLELATHWPLDCSSVLKLRLRELKNFSCESQFGGLFNESAHGSWAIEKA
jgi:hypothetical protein